MSSSTPGNTTSEVEVTHIAGHGLWLLCRKKKMFLSFEHFPWFVNQPAAKVMNVEELSPEHFYWPDIDIDLTQEIIEHPERFPLIAKVG